MTYKIDIQIDKNRIIRLAEIMADLKLKGDKYIDPKFFPPPETDREIQLGYFAAMVAIDHRTSSPFGVFEGEVDGEILHGADLLYRLGMKVLEGNPEFFYAKNLARIGEKDILNLISFRGKPLWDLHVRTLLLRDLGMKTLEYYDGKFKNLFNVSTIMELINRLIVFRAYEDPVHKKIFLLAKFLHGRGLVHFRDKENFEVAVDNHLSRIAIRTGIVVFSDYSPIERQIELSRGEDINVRLTIRKSWKEVSKESGYDPFTLDDFLWKFGRTICIRDKPRCEECQFASICLAHNKKHFWNEHRHVLTWYY